jgi:hypothetical protein
MEALEQSQTWNMSSISQTAVMKVVGLKASDVDTNHAEFDGTRSKSSPLTEPAG